MQSEVTLRPCMHDDRMAGFSHRERRVWIVVGLTTMTMVVELVVGTIAHSLALMAEGWHMASHAGALGFSGLAYWYARSRANREHYAFGTGKVYALAGYTNAVVLLVAAALLAVQAVQRLAHSEPIAFAEALPVAILGLLANVASIVLLGGVSASRSQPGGRSTVHDNDQHRGVRLEHDHNLRAAYLHVLADTLTGVLAITALLGARYLGLGFLDPMAGLVGGVAIASFGVGLLRSSALPLLDAVPMLDAKATIRARLEACGDVDVTDVRLWQTGPGQLGCIISLVGREDSLDVYRSAVLDVAPVGHLAIEVSRPRVRAGS
jgi:cation diffusion facilitator family transporter